MADQTNVPADETGVANPYLETLQSSLATGAAPAAAGGNPYLSMLEDAEELRRVRMSANVTDAVTVNPDQYAAQRKVAKYLGYPPAAVEAMPDITKQQAQVKAVQQAAATSPVLERRYSDADFAKLAHDDTGTLSQVAGWFTSGARYVFSAPDARNTLAGDIGASAYDASRGVAGVLQAGADLLAPLFDPLAGTVLPENPLRRLSAGMAEAGAAAKRTGDRLSPPSGDVVQGGVSSGVRSLGQNALMLPLALLPGGQGAALGGMTGMAGGQAYQQAREAGLPLSQALPFAASQAAIEYATEKLPLEQLIGSVKAGAPVLRTLAQQAGLEIPGEQIATVLQDMNEWAVLPENKDKPFSAYIAERPNAAAQTLIATVVGVGGNVAIAQGVERLVGDAEARQQAQADQQRVAELFALAGQSRLRERSPDSFAEVVQEMADQSDAPKEVRFDARTLVDVLQQAGVDEAQLVEMLPSVLPQLQEALSTGGEVTVPLGEFSKVVGTELEQTLLDNARIGQNELSQAEAKAAGEQAAQLMQEQAQRIAEQATNSVAVMAGNDAVKTTVLDQLNSTKRFTADVNEAYATLVANFYTVMGGRLGVTADQLYAQYPLRVQGEGVGDLDQPAYHGSPHRGIEQFTTQKIGTGEGAQAYGWGMYFAGSKDIAEFYRKGLSYREIVREFRDELPDDADFDDALAAAETMSPERARAIRALAANDWLGFDYPSQAITAAFKELDYYDPSDELRDAVNAARGQLYTVEVPHDGDLLDYDAPLDEQPEKVRKALEALGFPAEQYRLRRTFGATMFFPSREAARQHVKESNDAGVIEPVPSRKDGKTIYGEIVAKLGSPEAASRALFAAGIPGLRYLDAGSRGAKADGKSWNYVIFDDSAVRKTGELYQGGNNDVTQTDAFKRWFGDSKVVDANGEPLVVYHGTTADFSAFDPKRLGKSTGHPTAGLGFFFSADSKIAQLFTESIDDTSWPMRPKARDGANLMPVYLSIKKPYGMDVETFRKVQAVPYGEDFEREQPEAAKRQHDWIAKNKQRLLEQGYDGIHIKGDPKYADVMSGEEYAADAWVAFEPEQIKSAIGNSGAFDPNDPSILNQGPRGTFNPSNLTISLLEKADLSTDVTQTDAFKRWFGDSKVVDANGEPLVVYHGTQASVDAFNTRGGTGKTSGTGSFFTDNPKTADTYAGGEGGNVAPVYLSLQHPAVIDAQGANWNAIPQKAKVYLPKVDVSDQEVRKTLKAKNTNVRGLFAGEWDYPDDTASTDDIARWARNAGYDGVVIKNVRDRGPSRDFQSEEARAPSTVYVAFRPEQIKSAIGNSGAFDPNDPSILNQGPRGTFNPSNLTISLLEKADLSTFLHETGHFFMVSLFNMASQPNAPSAIADDVSTLLKWFGVKDMETWNGMTLEQQRKSHERFAESFEQYLLEGKAPSLELQPLFSRFRAWLINVYRSLTDFLRNRDTQLSDEVRAVFDRLIATEQQIQQAQAIRRYEPLFRSAEQAGMTPQQWAAYQSQGQRATDTAMDQLQARSLRDMRWTTNARSRALKALQKDVAGKRKAVEAEVRAEVEQQAIYQAMRWLRKGEMTTPEGEEIKAEKGFRLNTDALAEMYPEPMLGRPDMERLKGMTAGNGLHPDMVAEMFGFESGDHLVRALIDAHPMASVVEGMTDQRLLERFGDLVTESGIQRAADEAVHNEARARFVASELKALQAAQGQTARTAAGGNVNVMVRAAKQFAENLIAQRKVRELKPGQHTAAETRAARNAERALVKGDTQGAIVAKRDQLLNHYAARVTNDTLAEIERAVEYLKKFDKEATRKKLPPEYLDQIDKLLERVDLRQVSNRALDKRAKLAAWIEEQKAMGVEPEIPDYLLEDAQLTSYRGMQVEAFRGLVDTVKQIEHLGRVKNKLLTAKDQREFAAIRDSIAQSILDNAGNRTADSRTPTTNLGRALGAVKQFGAAHVKAATWARILDGGKDGGPVWEYFIRSANEAGDTETGLVAKATADLSKIMAPLLERSKLGGKGRYFQSIGRSLNRESVLAIALNVGNESNLQRLMGGEGWSPAQVKDILDTLQPEDWKAVQAIWDYFETFRPLIAEKEKRVFGREPKWIEPGSYFTETYGVKGGYYPIKYDPAASQRAEEHADAEGAKRQLQGAYGAATTKRSFTKSRAEEVSGRPLLYTLSGVYSGVNEVIHDLSWHEWLIDVNRLLRSKQIDAAIREKYGPEVVRQFKAWRDDIAEGDAAPQRALDMALGRLRQSVSVAGLGFNVVSAMMQPLGLAQSIQRVGPRWVGRGLMDFIGSPLEAGREVNEKSKFMANRARTRFRELNELRNRVQGQSALKRAINENAYRLMMAFQRMVDVPTWLGAYEKAITDGQDEKRAVALADQTVIDSQGGGQTKDLSAIERGPQALKLFTTFYSFMNTALNLGVASKMTPRSRARFAADMLLLYVVPAVLGSMLKDAITPGDGGDDDEALARKLAAEQLSYLLGMVVIGREFGQVAQTVTGAGSRDYTGPAGVRAIADVYQFAKQAGQGEFDDSFRKATINLAGDLFGLPSAQINRSVTGIQALTEGKTANPAAVVFGYQEPR